MPSLAATGSASARHGPSPRHTTSPWRRAEMMQRRREYYSTEIRGDGIACVWTLHHALGTMVRYVTVFDARGEGMTDAVRIGVPSPGEVSITFPAPPRFGQRYEVEVVA